MSTIRGKTKAQPFKVYANCVLLSAYGNVF